MTNQLFKTPESHIQAVRCIGSTERFKILHFISSFATVKATQLQQFTEWDKAKLSFHLRSLINAGIIIKHHIGGQCYYRIRPELTGWIGNILRNYKF